MDTLDELIISLKSEGFSCSQMLFLLAENYHQRENDDIIRAMSGLSGGMLCEDTCGALTGGCALLGMYVGGGKTTTKSAAFPEIIVKFHQWFEETYHATKCNTLLENKAGEPTFCLGLVRAVFEKCLLLLNEYEIDLYRSDD